MTFAHQGDSPDALSRSRAFYVKRSSVIETMGNLVIGRAGE